VLKGGFGLSFRYFYKEISLLYFMAGDNILGGAGGLMRYKEEYNSKFKFGPGAVIAMIIVVVLIEIGLRLFL
jgi:preprotein translocase subunit Sec61beta